MRKLDIEHIYSKLQPWKKIRTPEQMHYGNRVTLKAKPISKTILDLKIVKEVKIFPKWQCGVLRLGLGGRIFFKIPTLTAHNFAAS